MAEIERLFGLRSLCLDTRQFVFGSQGEEEQDGALVLKVEADVPDLRIASLKIWIHGRDGDWLRVTAQCKSVLVAGSILSLSQVEHLLEDCEPLYRTLQGTAVLDRLEPELELSIESVSRGHFSVHIAMTPDPIVEGHWYIEDIDQTDLAGIINDCRSVLEMYPIRGR